MRWWDTPGLERAFESLVEGLNHSNSAARPGVVNLDRIVDAFRAIEALANGAYYAKYGMSRTEARQLENEGRELSGRRPKPSRRIELAEILREYSRGTFTFEERRRLLNSRDVRALEQLRPLIHDEEAADEYAKGNHCRIVDVPQDVLDNHRHRDLVMRLQKYDEQPNSEESMNALEALVAVFYQVRNNRDHGLKQRTKRNKDVGTVTYHGMRRFIDGALDMPSQRLAVYGTLCTGKANHARIDDLGSPEIGRVRATLKMKDGYQVLTSGSSGNEVEAELYRSKELTNGRWKHLDEFEGTAYRRILIPVKLTSGQHVVATTYADSRSDNTMYAVK